MIILRDNYKELQKDFGEVKRLNKAKKRAWEESIGKKLPNRSQRNFYRGIIESKKTLNDLGNILNDSSRKINTKATESDINRAMSRLENKVKNSDLLESKLDWSQDERIESIRRKARKKKQLDELNKSKEELDEILKDVGERSNTTKEKLKNFKKVIDDSKSAAPEPPKETINNIKIEVGNKGKGTLKNFMKRNRKVLAGTAIASSAAGLGVLGYRKYKKNKDN